ERWHIDTTNDFKKNIQNKFQDNLEKYNEELQEMETQILSGEKLSQEDFLTLIDNFRTKMNENVSTLEKNIVANVDSSLTGFNKSLKDESLTITNRIISYRDEQEKLLQTIRTNFGKLLVDVSGDYSNFYNSLNQSIEEYSTQELELLKENRNEIEKLVSRILNREGKKTSQKIKSLQDDFEEKRRDYNEKTKETFQEIEQTLLTKSEELLEQEKDSHNSLMNLTDNIISELSNKVNSTAEKLRTNLGDGADTIFDQASAEVSKLEIELETITEQVQKETLEHYEAAKKPLEEQLEYLEERVNNIKEIYIMELEEFRNDFRIFWMKI
ncbi:MAG: hypothetical protein U9O98_10875, partial [Asgard group archaeon]|nr:hypothetical protein [Asgard group archaeon]